MEPPDRSSLGSFFEENGIWIFLALGLALLAYIIAQLIIGCRTRHKIKTTIFDGSPSDLLFFSTIKIFLGKLALKYRPSQLTVIKIIKIHQVKQNFSVKLTAKKDLQLDLNYKGRFLIILLFYFVKKKQRLSFKIFSQTHS